VISVASVVKRIETWKSDDSLIAERHLNRHWLVPSAVLALCCLPQSTAAQAAPALQASAAYVYVNDPTVGVAFRGGWSVGAAKGLNDWLSIAISYDDSRRTVPTVAGDVQLGLRTLMAGGQASARLGRATEFGQVLAGLVHTSGTAFGVSEGGTYAGVQAGAGLDYPLARKVALRIELDYRAFFNSTGNLGHQIRGLAGFAFTLR